MHLIRHLPESTDRATAVAIGNFDGLHLGHQAVLATMVMASRAKDLVPTVLTFEPHPRRYFLRHTPPFRIARLRDKLEGLKSAGVEQVAMPRFNAAFATMSAEDFLDNVLRRQLRANVVVTGENFAFGHQRRGDIKMLKAWGKKHNIDIIAVQPFRVGNEICSSSVIRAAIATGDVTKAARFLGHFYTLSGHVTRGDGRGRTIGFPTANIHLPPPLLPPAFGVYAVRAKVDGSRFNGVANFGIRPTVTADRVPKLEVHLFDTLQEIYGKTLIVSFVDRLRGEHRFANVEELKHQIAKDCDAAKSILRSRND